MTKRIFSSIFFTAFVVLILCSGILLGLYYSGYVAKTKDAVERECRLVKEGVESFGEECLGEFSTEGLRVTLVRPDGTVAYDTDAGIDPSALGNHLDREEIIEALSSGEGYAVRYSESKMHQTVYFALLLESGSVLRVATEHNSAYSVLLSTFAPLILIFIVVVLIALAVAVKLSRSIIKPLSELDTEHPERAVVYEELRPVVDRLIERDRRISSQMNELTLRRMEFDSIASNMTSGMIIINSKAEILFCNNSAKEIFSSGKTVPKNILSLYNTESFRAAVSSALSGDNGYSSLKREDKYYSIVVAPVLNDEFTVGAVIIIFDETEKAKREELRREFSANVSHELKTPLTSIMGYAELIGNGIADGADARSFAEDIHSEATRLLALVGDIIRLNQVDGGEIPYDGKIEIMSILNSVKTRLHPIAQSKNISIGLEGEEAHIMGNYQIFEELIYNLVDNGITYGKEGGFVNVLMKKQDGSLTVTVSDNGIGIPKGQQERVFERFYRVDKSHSKSIGGTGLGLSIVKHAVAYHRGTLKLESELGKGTSVELNFPVI